jgi:hypothetical protein
MVGPVSIRKVSPLALLLTLLVAMFAVPMASADAIYSFYDTNHNLVLQFSTPSIVTPSTPPVQLTNFLVAPSGFVPCSLQIFSGSTANNTLGCAATGLIAGQQQTWEEIWIVMNNLAFPTAPGSFTIPFGDLQFGFFGDIPVDVGSISVTTTTTTPEPASMLLLATGFGALGVKRFRLHVGRKQQRVDAL